MVFHESDAGSLSVAQISRQKEGRFRLPAPTWRDLMETCYPQTGWLCLRNDVFDRIDAHRSHRGLPMPDAAIERLISSAEGH